MEETFSEKIEYLRKKSRSLLTQVDQNIRRLSLEIQRCQSESCIDSFDKSTEKGLKAWKLRNDSTAVSKLLHPDSSTTPRQIPASMPNIVPCGRIVLTSEKSDKYQCTENVQRKPVKGCYCNAVLNKTEPKSSRTHQKHTSGQSNDYTEHCSKAQRINDPEILTPPISCETLRRVQRIDYTPKSQFLRNVQNKVSQLQNLSLDSPLSSCARSSLYHKVMAESTRDAERQTICCHDIKKSHKTRKTTSGTISKVPANIQTSEDDENDEYCHSVKSSREVHVPSRKQLNSRFIIKKTLSSKKSVPESKKEKSVARSPKKKKSKEAPYCPCCTCRNSSEKSLRSQSAQVVYYSPTVCTNCDTIEEKEYLSHEVRDLRKFREQNYFDTHGSSHTLVSSASSGSLEQCLLNERLFAEPVRRIHTKDLMVTIPACATVQRKRVHYFPRYTVKQMKTDSNTSHKKRRCKSCPLTGHAIDLGVLKTRPPTNSLALKYQKHIT